MSKRRNSFVSFGSFASFASFASFGSFTISQFRSFDTIQEVSPFNIRSNRLRQATLGPEKITSNMHLCLHICECALDYGLLYSFWCYSFERMNGLLGNININTI